MANQEQLAILKQGVETWNQWRKENPDLRPDLGEAILQEVNFSGANLALADLSGAKEPVPQIVFRDIKDEE